MIKRRLLLKHSVVGAMTWLAGSDIANPSAACATHDGFNQITDAYPSQIGFSQTYPTTYDGWSEAFLAGNEKRGIMVFGNPLHETVGCFIVTDVLRQKIERANASGVAFGSVEISKSSEFEELFPDQELPDFVWLQACGKAGVDDFGLSADNRLVASERMLALCREEGISHCVIVELE